MSLMKFELGGGFTFNMYGIDKCRSHQKLGGSDDVNLSLARHWCKIKSWNKRYAKLLFDKRHPHFYPSPLRAGNLKQCISVTMDV